MTKVLLADDVRLFLELEKSFLKRTGCRVFTASNGKEAWDQVRRHRPDLVLLDAEMPVMDGPACCRKIKSDPGLRATPVIFVSATLAPEACAEAGGDALVRKPFSKTSLLTEIRRFLPLVERACERVPVSFRVEYAGKGKVGSALTKDLCADGLFLKTTDRLEAGDGLELTFAIPATEAPMRTRARVVRVVTPDPDSHLVPGAGMRFEGLGAADRGRIAAFVRERLA